MPPKRKSTAVTGGPAPKALRREDSSGLAEEKIDGENGQPPAEQAEAEQEEDRIFYQKAIDEIERESADLAEDKHPEVGVRAQPL